MLTRDHKTFFKKVAYAILVGFLLGLWVWLSLFRVIRVTDEGKTSYLLISLEEPEVGDEVVFSYPNLNSPLRTSKVFKGKKNVLTVNLDEDTTEPLNEDLTTGVVLFSF